MSIEAIGGNPSQYRPEFTNRSKMAEKRFDKILEKRDADENGTLGVDEVRFSEERFSQIDKDSDGQITKEEMAEKRAQAMEHGKMMGIGKGQGPGKGKGPSSDFLTELLESLYSNDEEDEETEDTSTTTEDDDTFNDLLDIIA